MARPKKIKVVQKKEKAKLVKIRKVATKTKTKEKVQDVNYWVSRPLNDKAKDWLYGEKNWLEGYEKSVEHPHRQLILDVLKRFEPIGSVLEMGCATAPNLVRIFEQYPENQMVGYDANEQAIARAKELLPKAVLTVGQHTAIPFDEKFDVVIADATLLYVGPDEIDQVMAEINRVAGRLVILVERDADSLKGEIKSHVMGRDYAQWLELMGFQVEKVKLTEEQWPGSKGWAQHGYLYVGSRVQ